MRGKYTKPKRRGVGRKLILMLLAVILIVGCTISGTLAWLVADSGPVVNTFTYGDITLELWEHDYDPTANTIGGETVDENDDYKILPGVDLPKAPTVVVGAGSEDCWLFIKVAEKNWPNLKIENTDDRKVDWAINTDWTQLKDDQGTAVPGVYYRKVLSTAAERSFQILKDNKITVDGSLKKDEITDTTSPIQLEFTAYACQVNDGGNGFTAPEAWQKIQDEISPSPAP